MQTNTLTESRHELIINIEREQLAVRKAITEGDRSPQILANLANLNKQHEEAVFESKNKHVCTINYAIIKLLALEIHNESCSVVIQNKDPKDLKSKIQHLITYYQNHV